MAGWRDQIRLREAGLFLEDVFAGMSMLLHGFRSSCRKASVRRTWTVTSKHCWRGKAIAKNPREDELQCGECMSPTSPELGWHLTPFAMVNGVAFP